MNEILKQIVCSIILLNSFDVVMGSGHQKKLKATSERSSPVHSSLRVPSDLKLSYTDEALNVLAETENDRLMRILNSDSPQFASFAAPAYILLTRSGDQQIPAANKLLGIAQSHDTPANRVGAAKILAKYAPAGIEFNQHRDGAKAVLISIANFSSMSGSILSHIPVTAATILYDTAIDDREKEQAANLLLNYIQLKTQYEVGSPPIRNVHPKFRLDAANALITWEKNIIEAVEVCLDIAQKSRQTKEEFERMPRNTVYDYHNYRTFHADHQGYALKAAILGINTLKSYPSSAEDVALVQETMAKLYRILKDMFLDDRISTTSKTEIAKALMDVHGHKTAATRYLMRLNDSEFLLNVMQNANPDLKIEAAQALLEKGEHQGQARTALNGVISTANEKISQASEKEKKYRLRRLIQKAQGALAIQATTEAR